MLLVHLRQNNILQLQPICHFAFPTGPEFPAILRCAGVRPLDFIAYFWPLKVGAETLRAEALHALYFCCV
eukprot:s1804_g9.t3